MKSMLMAVAAAGFLFAASPAHAQLFYNEPAFERGPIDPADPLVGIPLPNATPAEARAGLIWNLRAGLNVAALRCQFSKYLRAVDNYNAAIAHHSTELASAYQTLEKYFGRLNGTREGQRAFDRWNTQTYQNYSTSQSYGFCQTATNIGKEALTRRKGEFGALAQERMRELRNSMRPHTDRIFAGGSALPPLPQTIFATPVCTGLTGPALQQCLTGGPVR